MRHRVRIRREKIRKRCGRTGKVLYTSPGEAENEAARLIAGGQPVNVYHCPHAEHYHIGTMHKMRGPRE
jgi:hypothetical protein